MDVLKRTGVANDSLSNILSHRGAINCSRILNSKVDRMNHERNRQTHNRFIKFYGGIGRTVCNTLAVVRHELSPPKPEFREASVTDRVMRSELVIVDDERAIIEEVER